MEIRKTKIYAGFSHSLLHTFSNASCLDQHQLPGCHLVANTVSTHESAALRSALVGECFATSCAVHEVWNTGGNIYVAVIPLGPHDCAGVTGEVICRYHDSKATSMSEVFDEPDNDTTEGCVSLCD